MDIKKGYFEGKKRVSWLEKLQAGNQNRKAKWCKMQLFFLITDKREDVKDWKRWRFTYCLTSIFARPE